MTTYTELVDQIRDYTETTSDVLTTTVVNDFIEHAEKRIFRDVDLDIFRSYQFATLTQGNPFVSLPGAGTDLEIFHDTSGGGTDNVIQTPNVSHSLKIKSDSIILTGRSGSSLASFSNGGA